MRSSLHFRQTSQRPQKAAKARVRKATLELEKLGKQYRKESVNTLSEYAARRSSGLLAALIRIQKQKSGSVLFCMVSLYFKYSLMFSIISSSASRFSIAKRSPFAYSIS